MKTTIEHIPESAQANEEGHPVSVKRLKVCHLSMTLETGGLERLLVDYGRFHDSNKFELSFVALEGIGHPAQELRESGFQIDQIGLSKIGKLTGMKRLAQLFREHQIDILHTHNTYPQFYGAFAARFAKVPIVINSQHGRGCGPNRKSLWQFRLANHLTTRVVGVSEDATKLCQDQNRSNADKMTCIWNGIDLERFRFRGPHDSLSAISVGRLSPEKDYATLLHATKIVLESYPEFQLILIGDGQERQQLEDLSNELGMNSNVTFLGERSDVHDLLATAGFFVSSSTTEGISLTLLEAMAVGLPIVTTAVGGSPEIVVPGETGKLVPPRSPDQLAHEMIAMIEERAIWPEIGKAARERVEEHFNIRTMIRQYEELYSELYEKRND
ncbi:glycosyltransferase [Thalassoglobus sp.]|uniref:glycosyltransferase n=1 Tax=Thalassoglobus sp. TaxID=2795869 RepID=UPI003AA9A082